MEYIEINLLRLCADLHSRLQGILLEEFKPRLYNTLLRMKQRYVVHDYQFLENKFVLAAVSITFSNSDGTGEGITGKFLFYRRCFQIMMQEKAYLYTFDNGILREYDKTAGAIIETGAPILNRHRPIKVTK